MAASHSVASKKGEKKIGRAGYGTIGEVEREEGAESSLNGRASLESVIRLRFKSARLETRDARPVVSDNGLLFFRGQMLDQNRRQRRYRPPPQPLREDRRRLWQPRRV